jgi:hypothetical protein
MWNHLSFENLEYFSCSLSIFNVKSLKDVSLIVETLNNEIYYNWNKKLFCLFSPANLEKLENKFRDL